MRFLRPGLVEILDIGTQDTMQLLLLQDEQVIQTLATHAAKEAFTDGIGPWCVIRRFEYLDAATCSHTRETGSELVITIANEILRSLSIRGYLSQLLCSPGIGRRACDPHIDHFARVQFDDEEGPKASRKKRSVTGRRVTGPDLLGMRM